MSEPLETKAALIHYFESGAKPREKWRIGTEYEKVLVHTIDGSAIPFSGSNGVEEILRRMAERHGFDCEQQALALPA